MLGVARNSKENNVKRYCVYSKECVYYLTEVNNLRFGIRLFVNENKQIIISIIGLNNGKEEKIYISSYFNCLFKYQTSE
ncbi:MAG: hypothetical protein V8R16_07710 [Bacilli bacterium]